MLFLSAQSPVPGPVRSPPLRHNTSTWDQTVLDVGYLCVAMDTRCVHTMVGSICMEEGMMKMDRSMMLIVMILVRMYVCVGGGEE